MEVEGALAEIFAAFDKNGKLDEDKTGQYLKFLSGNGTSGLFVGGIAAETMSFSQDERKRWLDMVIKKKDKDLAVIFQIQYFGNYDVLEQIKYAEEAGADILSFSQPYPAPLSAGETLEYLGFLCGQTSLPVMIYNEPAVGKAIDVNTLDGLIKRCRNIKYYKDSTHNMIDLHTIMMQNKNLNVLAGSDGLIFDIMNAGGKGVVSLVINAFPELVAQAVKAIGSGDLKSGLKLQEKIMQIRAILKAGGLTAGYRYAMGLRGIDIGEPQRPYSRVGDEAKKYIKTELKNIGVL